MAQTDVIASSGALLQTAEAIARRWGNLGIDGHFLARSIDSGEELGFAVDRPVPLASVAKVPIALTALDLVELGELAPDQTFEVTPKTASPGSTGTSGFRYPARIALADLIGLMLSVSDNAAADVVLDLVGITRVTSALRSWGVDGIRIRHPMGRMFESATRASSGQFEVALELAVQAGAAAVSAIDVLDLDRANTGSAQSLVNLLQRVWTDQIASPAACSELRRLMATQVFTHRLASDLRSDTITVSGKTGSFLNLRHEIGVVASEMGDHIVIAALTRSDRPATFANDIDLSIGAAARIAFEALRA